MRYIEIKTSHNIVLQFELATLMQRILALLLDMMIQYFVSILFYFLIVSITNNETAYFVMAPIWIFYNLAFELFNNGQTIGKKILKIRVVSLDGKSVSLRNSIIRWAFRIVDIVFSSGLLAIISIFSSEKSQRIGDLLANTTVISLSEKKYKSLKSLSKLSSLDYEMTYPAVAMYNDEDMLLLKNTLQRLKKSPNNDTKQFCIQLATKIKKDLDLPAQKIGAVKFLNKILDDYIMITR